jgi:hypothetical protein
MEVAVVMAGREHGDGVGLVEPREIVEVGVLPELVVDVVVSDLLDRCGDNGNPS